MRQRVPKALLALLLVLTGTVAFSANEITTRITRTVTKGDLRGSVEKQKVITMSGSVIESGVQAVGTTAEALDTGDVGTLGRLFLLNLDTTNYVTFGPDSGGSMVGAIKLMPGEPNEFRLVPGVTYKLQADTAACNVQYELLSD